MVTAGACCAIAKRQGRRDYKGRMNVPTVRSNVSCNPSSYLASPPAFPSFNMAQARKLEALLVDVPLAQLRAMAEIDNFPAPYAGRNLGHAVVSSPIC